MAVDPAFTQHPRMRWCFQPLTNSARLWDIYFNLDERESERKKKTLSELNNPYITHVADLDFNRIKNRYSGIHPYDANRIRLPNPIHESDYINASYVVEPDFGLPLRPTAQGNLPFSHPRGWIASQGPLPETRYEFLSLFLHPDPNLRPQVVIQLTACLDGGFEKSAPYIPGSVGDSLEFRPYHPARESFGTQTSSRGVSKWFHWEELDEKDRNSYGLIRVTLESSVLGPVDPSGDEGGQATSFYRKNSLVIQTSQLGSSNCPAASISSHLMSRSRVTHFECIDWPDQGVPKAIDPMLELINAANAASLSGEHSAPILVHCSAGIGRTGTLIAVASCLSQLQLLAEQSPEADKVDILNELPPPLLAQDPGRLSPLPSDLHADLVARTIDCLREQRAGMVETKGQLEFVYKAVARVLKLQILEKGSVGS